MSLFQIALENWDIARNVMEGGLSLQRWLAEGGSQQEPEAGGSGQDAGNYAPGTSGISGGPQGS
jgi:hypothetical protein